MSSLHRRSLRLFGGTLLVYALLVATHLGEFWPFSIYPMFSQAGNPWSRTVIRSVPDVPRTASWDTLRVSDPSELPGRAFPLASNDVNTIELAGFVSQTETWSASRIGSLRRLFRDHLDDTRLLVLRVNGRLQPDGTVVVQYVPYVYLGPDQAALHPSISLQKAASPPAADSPAAR